jgi:hypothetical protein
MKWSGPVAGKKSTGNVKYIQTLMKTCTPLESVGEEGKIILKCAFKKQEKRFSNGFSRLRTGTKGGH